MQVKTAKYKVDPSEVFEHKSPQLKDLPKTWANFPRLILLLPIRLYQLTLSRSLPSDTCRYYPTCSHYGYQSIFRFGFFKGGWMAITRLLRCNPYNEGGYDPVPEKLIN